MKNIFPLKPVYKTEKGICYAGSSEYMLENDSINKYKHQVDLIFTSPPFPLNNTKAYGNHKGLEYIDWLGSFAKLFRKMISPSGSIVIEIGNSWEPNIPAMSTVSIEALLEFKRAGDFYLCQEFIWNNTSKLPSPITWVNIDRVRVKDSFTKIWWFSKSHNPKACNKNVLNEYSEGMKKLLKTKKYNSGRRPSEHYIGKNGFLKDNGGSIPSNVLSISNTISNDPYLTYCSENEIRQHPARMPPGLAKFFIRFLTDEGDLVMDPFAGSNVTGAVAEELDRRWLAIEKKEEYAIASKARFNEYNRFYNW